jgi:hypothetical protein
MITEAFSEISEKSTEDFSNVKFHWVESEKTISKFYFVNMDTGKVHGHVIQEYDLWNANFNFTHLGRYISRKDAQLAVVEASIKK